MQKVILIDECNNLYNLIAAIADAKADGADSIMLWSQSSSTTLFQSVDELELIERYARKFDLEMALSAASDPILRTMAEQVGWKVFWQIPGLDALLEREAIQHEANQWVIKQEKETRWQAAG